MAQTSQQMLDFYIAAEVAVLKGQSVRHGERQLTRADLAEIRQGRREWQGIVNAEARRGSARYATADFGGIT